MQGDKRIQSTGEQAVSCGQVRGIWAAPPLSGELKLQNRWCWLKLIQLPRAENRFSNLPGLLTSIRCSAKSRSLLYMRGVPLVLYLLLLNYHAGTKRPRARFSCGQSAELGWYTAPWSHLNGWRVQTQCPLGLPSATGNAIPSPQELQREYVSFLFSFI